MLIKVHSCRRPADELKSSSGHAEERLVPGNVDGLMTYITEDFNKRAYFITGAKIAFVLPKSSVCNADQYCTPGDQYCTPGAIYASCA